MDDKKYAFLMISFDTPELIQDIQNNIPERELYIDETDTTNKYGIEKDTHVTLVPKLDNNTDINEIKKYLKDIKRYKTILTNISVFKSDKYDVLKCDASSVLLHDTNSDIVKNFKTYSDYDEYHPHVTIAYLKSGMSDKYVKDYLPKLIVLEPKSFIYSYYDNNGKHKNIKFID